MPCIDRFVGLIGRGFPRVHRNCILYLFRMVKCPLYFILTITINSYSFSGRYNVTIHKTHPCCFEIRCFILSCYCFRGAHYLGEMSNCRTLFFLKKEVATVHPIQGRILCELIPFALEIDISKAKFFTISHNASHRGKISEIFEQVRPLKYLSSTVNPNGQTRDGVKLRVDCARKAFLSLCKVLGSKRSKPLHEAVHLPSCRLPSSYVYM